MTELEFPDDVRAEWYHRVQLGERISVAEVADQMFAAERTHLSLPQHFEGVEPAKALAAEVDPVFSPDPRSGRVLRVTPGVPVESGAPISEGGNPTPTTDGTDADTASTDSVDGSDSLMDEEEQRAIEEAVAAAKARRLARRTARVTAQGGR